MWPNSKYVCAESINYYAKWGNILLYWLNNDICVLTLPTLYPQIPNLPQYNTSNFVNEFPKHANE